MLTDGLEWCGLLWCFYQTLILTAPIHCRASIAETLMQRHISTNLMKKQTHLHLRWSEGEHIYSYFSFLGELFLKSIEKGFISSSHSSSSTFFLSSFGVSVSAPGEAVPKSSHLPENRFIWHLVKKLSQTSFAHLHAVIKLCVFFPWNTTASLLPPQTQKSQSPGPHHVHLLQRHHREHSD